MTSMGALKLFGRGAAWDEIVTIVGKRRHEPRRVVGDLLPAELSEKQARSITYPIAAVGLPLARRIGEFAFGRMSAGRPDGAEAARRRPALGAYRSVGC